MKKIYELYEEKEVLQALDMRKGRSLMPEKPNNSGESCDYPNS
jgi:hypothetical protein